MAQHGAKMEPRWSHDGPRWSQDGSRWSQDGPRWSQDVRECAPRKSKNKKARALAPAHEVRARPSRAERGEHHASPALLSAGAATT